MATSFWIHVTRRGPNVVLRVALSGAGVTHPAAGRERCACTSSRRGRHVTVAPKRLNRNRRSFHGLLVRVKRLGPKPSQCSHRCTSDCRIHISKLVTERLCRRPGGPFAVDPIRVDPSPQEGPLSGVCRKFEGTLVGRPSLKRVAKRPQQLGASGVVQLTAAIGLITRADPELRGIAGLSLGVSGGHHPGSGERHSGRDSAPLEALSRATCGRCAGQHGHGPAAGGYRPGGNAAAVADRAVRRATPAVHPSGDGGGAAAGGVTDCGRLHARGTRSSGH
jgi:hypothetical protein